jgi:glycerol-3-phosphate O-acyltransferase
MFHSIQREQLIPHVASTIDSYMKEHNVSIEVAREKINTLKEESWKDFNSEWLNPDNTYPKQLLERIFNLTRTMEFMYNREDNFTNCSNLKDTIHSLLVEPYTKLI